MSIRAVSRLPILRAAQILAVKSSFTLEIRSGSTTTENDCSLLLRSRQVPFSRKGDVPTYLPAKTAGAPE